VGREADTQVEATRFCDGDVFLADVDEVGFAFGGEIGTVVDDEGHAQAARYFTRVREYGEQLRIGELLVANLDDVDAAADRRLEKALEVRPRRRDQVQALHLIPPPRPRSGSSTGNWARDDELVSVYKLDFVVLAALDRLAVPLDERVTAA
jgi:hypothetical protein